MKISSAYWLGAALATAFIGLLAYYFRVLPNDWEEVASRSFCSGKAVETFYRVENPGDKETKKYWKCKL